MGIKVEKSGLLSTVQDLGRWGHQHEGVIVSGAMDTMAHRVANILVGNAEDMATLEFALLGPSLLFETDQLVCLAGGTFLPRLNGQEIALCRPTLIRKGALLEIGPAIRGGYGYLAVHGGIQVPLVMGSASTYVRAGLGGLHGSVLREGDFLPCSTLSAANIPYLRQEVERKKAFVQTNWFPAPTLLPPYRGCPVIRVIKGPEYDWFTKESQQALYAQPYKVGQASDRMGYRLEGAAVALMQKRELLSTAVAFGTVQVPAQGQPIVLMADHQTTGGYPRIAQVITADLPLLAQVPAGQSFWFKEVTLKVAYVAYVQQEQNLEQLKRAVALKQIR